jgi:hypothetical protein
MKTMKHVSHDFRDLNPGSFEYEAGVLTSRPRRSLKSSKFSCVLFYFVEKGLLSLHPSVPVSLLGDLVLEGWGKAQLLL